MHIWNRYICSDIRPAGCWADLVVFVVLKILFVASKILRKLWYGSLWYGDIVFAFNTEPSIYMNLLKSLKFWMAFNHD